MYGGTSLPGLVFTVNAASGLSGRIDNYIYLDCGEYDPVYSNNIVYDTLQVRTGVFLPGVMRN